MKLYLFFILIDLVTLVAYPIVFVAHHVRKMMGMKK
jgi:hypothetical protein